MRQLKAVHTMVSSPQVKEKHSMLWEIVKMVVLAAMIYALSCLYLWAKFGE